MVLTFLTIAVLVGGNVVTLGTLEDLGQKLQEQQSITAETRDALQGASEALQGVQKEKMDIESSLKKERLETKKLNREIQSLKAELQAKVERESRKEPNLYVWGNCTWYVKERIPYIGGTWGNANQWLASAQGYGFETGSKPKPGAIGVSYEGTYGHVVLVERVKGDSVTISEMNAPVAGVVTTRTIPANALKYIYT